jgi:hypothetical protein
MKVVSNPFWQLFLKLALIVLYAHIQNVVPEFTVLLVAVVVRPTIESRPDVRSFRREKNLT